MKIQLSHNDNLKVSKRVIAEFINQHDESQGGRLELAVGNLFREIERELDRFIAGRDDLTLTSIQVRNLFELYLITKHIVSSEKGLNSWFGQMGKDSMDIQNGFIELMMSHSQDVSELQEIKASLETSLNESPYTSKGGFNIKTLAEQYGYVNDYSAIHKLCSKLVHPTSIKVNAYDALTENNHYLAALEQVGVFFCQKIEGLSHEISHSKSA